MKRSREYFKVSFALCLTALVGCPKPVELPADATSDVIEHDSTMDVAASACVDGTCNGGAFREGPYGTQPRELAGPFTVPTTQGPWTFEQQFTGRDHYVFLVYTPGTFRFANGTDLSQALFEGPLDELLTKSPRNVHYFFLWERDEQGFNRFVASANDTFALLSPEDRAHWIPRVHFVTQRASMLPGWIGDLVRTRISEMVPYKRYDPFQFAIDRNQRVREVGQLGTLTTGGIAADLTFLAHEPQYFEFEAQREEHLRTENATVVHLATDQRVDDWEGPRQSRDAVLYAEVNLPDASMMARFDTLEVDFELHCPSHRDGECGAWDYLADLRLCEDVVPPADAGFDAGFEAASDASDHDANTSDAASDIPGNDADETFRPRRAGCDREVARWITPYWREGRWVTDISQMLPLIAQGGRRTFRWASKHQFDPREVPYYISLSLRLSNRGRGMRPSEVRTLWSGERERFDSTYDSRHPPQTVTVPAGVRKVELYSLITGHGAESGQCAEFCNHTHGFSVNGAAPSVLRFPDAQSFDGCALRVNEGVVPNQHGTWYFGRGGWCPGHDVRPHVIDITAQIRMGQSNTVTYTAGLNGHPLPAGRSYGTIQHTTYLVFWR